MFHKAIGFSSCLWLLIAPLMVTVPIVAKCITLVSLMTCAVFIEQMDLAKSPARLTLRRSSEQRRHHTLAILRPRVWTNASRQSLRPKVSSSWSVRFESMTGAISLQAERRLLRLAVILVKRVNTYWLKLLLTICIENTRNSKARVHEGLTATLSKKSEVFVECRFSVEFSSFTHCCIYKKRSSNCS